MIVEEEEKSKISGEQGNIVNADDKNKKGAKAPAPSKKDPKKEAKDREDRMIEITKQVQMRVISEFNSPLETKWLWLYSLDVN